MTYTIPDNNLGKLQTELARLSKRAVKLGQPPITLTVTKTVEEPVEVDGQTFYRRSHEIEVTGTAPKLNGWTFKGTLQHLEEGTLLRLVPDAGEIPVRFRTVKPYCEHCQVNRFRKDTFIVQHEAGEFKQVGRQCLKDFLGHTDPQNLANFAELLAACGEMCEDAEDDGWMGLGGGKVKRFSLLTFLGYSAEAIRQHGFISRKTASENGRQSTSDVALMSMFPPPKDQCDRDWKRLEVSEESAALAATAKEWAVQEFSARVEPTDFEHNLLVIAKGESMEERNAGLAAFVVQAYRRSVEKAELHKREANSNWVGEVGKRLRNLELTVVNSTGWETDFGFTTLYKMVDSTGNIFIWKSTTGAGLEQGKTYKVTGTVKKHDEYRGVKQTELSRCKAEDVVADAQLALV